MRPIPEPLLRGPFTPEFARLHGVSEKMLRGKRFRRLLPGVWVTTEHEMTRQDDIVAARLCLPDRARLSHWTRIEELGYDPGATGPIHFTIAGDHHVALPGIVLHRTPEMPPSDDLDVHPAAAFVQICATDPLQQVVRRGDFLLSNAHMTRADVIDLVRLQPWRRGSRQAVSVLTLLDDSVLSPRESDMRLWLIAAGLPRPTCNSAVGLAGNRTVRIDLWLEAWRHAIEVEGRQHFTDAAQVESDVHRYAAFREMGISYTQVTSRMALQPIATVMQVHQSLVARGYDGPAPTFEGRWRDVWQPISTRGLRWGR